MLTVTLPVSLTVEVTWSVPPARFWLPVMVQPCAPQVVEVLSPTTSWQELTIEVVSVVVLAALPVAIVVRVKLLAPVVYASRTTEFAGKFWANPPARLTGLDELP